VCVEREAVCVVREGKESVCVREVVCVCVERESVCCARGERECVCVCLRGSVCVERERERDGCKPRLWVNYSPCEFETSLTTMSRDGKVLLRHRRPFQGCHLTILKFPW
jgi:hypothetical protein